MYWFVVAAELCAQMQSPASADPPVTDNKKGGPAFRFAAFDAARAGSDGALAGDDAVVPPAARAKKKTVDFVGDHIALIDEFKTNSSARASIDEKYRFRFPGFPELCVAALKVTV